MDSIGRIIYIQYLTLVNSKKIRIPCLGFLVVLHVKSLNVGPKLVAHYSLISVNSEEGIANNKRRQTCFS